MHSVNGRRRDDKPGEWAVQTHRVGVSVESLLRREGGVRVRGRGGRRRAHRSPSRPFAPWMAGTAVAGVAIAGAASAAMLSDGPATNSAAAGPGWYRSAVPPIPSPPGPQLAVSETTQPTSATAPIADPAAIALLAQPGEVPSSVAPLLPSSVPAAGPEAAPVVGFVPAPRQPTTPSSTGGVPAPTPRPTVSPQPASPPHTAVPPTSRVEQPPPTTPAPTPPRTSPPPTQQPPPPPPTTEEPPPPPPSSEEPPPPTTEEPVTSPTEEPPSSSEPPSPPTEEPPPTTSPEPTEPPAPEE